MIIPVLSFGGGLEKGMEALKVKDFYGAKKQFEKILYRDPVGGSFGLSLVHFEDQNPFYNIRVSLRYIMRADSAFQFSLERNRVRLQEAGINGAAISNLRRDIGAKAYRDLMKNPTDSSIAVFMKFFNFSENFRDVMDMRNKRAFAKARESDSFQSYRSFIIEYPGSKQRSLADSLYALRFFEEKTSAGNVEGYRQFVREFPANPYAVQAYDTIFQWVNSIKSKEVYKDYINDFPENKNTDKAWWALNLILLRDYSAAQVRRVINTFPNNPYRSMLQQELELMGERRFILKDSMGCHLVGINGVVYGKTYDQIFEFHEGLARVTEEGCVGFIDKLGNEVIAPEYLDGFDFSGGMAVVEEEGLFGTIDRFGGVAIPFVYEELGNLADGYLAFEKEGDSGFIDFNGKHSFKRSFEFASDFNGGYAVVRVDGLYGAIDTTGSYSIPAQYDWVEENRDGQSRVRKGALYGLFVHGENLCFPVEYEAIGDPGSGLRSVVKEGKVGYLSENGEGAIPFEYDYSKENIKQMMFHANQAIFYKNGKSGLIDIEGKVLLNPVFDELVNTGNPILQYRLNGKWGHITQNGDKIGGGYDEVSPFHQGLSRIVKDGVVCLVQSNADPIIACDYKNLKPLTDTELIVYSDNSGTGLINREGEVVLEASYDTIEPLNIRFVKLVKDGQEELFDIIDFRTVRPPDE